VSLPGSVREMAAHFRECFPADRCLDLNFAGCTIRVCTNSQAVTSELSGYFKEFAAKAHSPRVQITVHECPISDLGLAYTVKEPDPGKTKIKEEWADFSDGRVVRKRLTGMVFIFGQGENLAVGPCLENANQVVNFINNRFIEWKLNQGGLLGHAAGVALNGRGLSLAGFSGAGKSTLALHLMSLGATFVSNDRVIVEQSGSGLVMYGVAKQPRINPGTVLNNPDLSGIVEPENLESFKNLAPEELRQLEHKYDALIDECFGPGRFTLRSVLSGLLILNWDREGGPFGLKRVDPEKRKDLLPAFIKSTGLFYLPSDLGRMADPLPDEYARTLARTRVYEITGGMDFAGAAEACLDLLKSGGPA